MNWKRGKLSSRYIGPFEILKRVRNVAYQLALLLELSAVHNVFHVSMLRKYVPDLTHVVRHQPLEIQLNLSYEEAPICIIAQKLLMLHNKEIPLVKVLWQHHLVEVATWEREIEMQAKYPELFEEFQGKFCRRNLI